MGQVVSADVAWSRSLERLRGSLNAVLPVDIRVLSVEQVAPAFNARFDAVSREYRYRVVLGGPTPPMLGRYAWTVSKAIEPDVARVAARVFQGSHSFGSFASAGKSRSLPACELRRDVLGCEWRDVEDGLFSAADGPAVNELRVVASGFLPQMVRNIVAAVVEVASGKESLEWLEYLLVSGDRGMLGAPAPPHGLSLWRVNYGDETAAVQTSMLEGWD
jgi:tRNA pseudouridine38-40 synthase